MTPSSRWLCRRLVNAAELSRCRCVVEFGPGTACLTREILDLLHPEATLFAFEVNEEFCKRLKRDCAHPRLVVVNDSAERVGEHIAAHGFEGADYVFSGLPFTTLPAEVRARILQETLSALRPGGKFIAYQYSLYLLRTLRSVFGDVKVGFELRNIPPAFCFVCTKSATKPHPKGAPLGEATEKTLRTRRKKFFAAPQRGPFGGLARITTTDLHKISTRFIPIKFS